MQELNFQLFQENMHLIDTQIEKTLNLIQNK